MDPFRIPNVLEVTDGGPNLLLQPNKRRGPTIPLQVEVDHVAGNEIGAGAVGCGNRSSVLLGKEPPVSTAGLLTDPQQHTFAQGEPAGEHEIDKESVGLQVMNHMPAVVPR